MTKAPFVMVRSKKECHLHEKFCSLYHLNWTCNLRSQRCSPQQPDDHLTVVPGHLGELIQDPAFLSPPHPQVPLPNRLTVLKYAASCNVTSVGNIFYEATIPPSVTLIMSQFGGLTARGTEVYHRPTGRQGLVTPPLS